MQYLTNHPMNTGKHGTSLGAEVAAMAAATPTDFAQSAAEATPLAVEEAGTAALAADGVAPLTEEAGAAYSGTAAETAPFAPKEAGTTTAAASPGAGAD